MVVPYPQHKQPYIPTPSRSSAQEQLNRLIDSSGSFAFGLNPGSRLGAALRYRLLGEWEVWHAIAALPPGALREQMTDCLARRAYFKGWLTLHPSFWTYYQETCAFTLNCLGIKQEDDYEAALAAETGIELFDSWTQELKDTGWLPHEVRLQYRDYWIKELGLPWVLGAAFFMTHLLDGDSAVNTLHWYEASGDKFCQDFKPQQLRSLFRGTDAELPSLSLSPSGLLVTPDDLAPEIGQLSEAAFSTVAVLAAEDVNHHLSLSRNVGDFCRKAVIDCGQRACSNWQADLIEVDGHMPFEGRGSAGPHHVSKPTRMRVYAGQVKRWTDSVVRWALRENLRMVRLYEPMVGPYHSQLSRLRCELRRVGVSLSLYRRQWDAAHSPHSQARFEDSVSGFTERANAALKSD